MASPIVDQRPQPSRSGPFHGPLRAFAYPRFTAFWAISFLSIVSFFMVLIVRGWLILELTDSPFMVSAVNAAQLLPMLALPLLGGALADRGARKMLLLSTDVFNLLSLLAMAALIWTGVVEVWHVFALALANGVAFSFAMPARTSLVPDLVQRSDIPSAVALFSTIFSLGQIAGPTPAGFIIKAWGMAPSFLVAALLLAPALVGIALFRVPTFAGGGVMAGGGRESMAQSILSGVRYVRGQPLLLALLLLGLIVNTFVMPFQAIMPVVVRDVLGRGPDDLGILMTATGVGALAGSLLVASAGGMRQLMRLLMVAGLAVGFVLAAFGNSQIFALSIVLGLLLGLCVQLFMTSNFTLIQMATPDEVRARVIGMRFIIIGLGPIGILSMGVAAELYGPAPSVLVMGLVNVALVALVLLLVPSIRRVRESASVVTRERQPSG